MDTRFTLKTFKACKGKTMGEKRKSFHYEELSTTSMPQGI